MVRDGIPWVAVPLALAIIPMLFGLWWIAIAFILVAAFMAFFFRDPRRSPIHEPHKGALWELPAGRCEAGEAPLEGARRELREETGIEGRATREDALEAVGL